VISEKGEIAAHFIQNIRQQKNENASLFEQMSGFFSFYDRPLTLMMTKIVQKNSLNLRYSELIVEKCRIKCANSA